MRSNHLPYTDDPTYWPTGFDKWTPKSLFKIFFYFSACLLALMVLPNSIWDPQVKQVTFVIGTLGIWRYGWWFTHAVRAMIYGHFVYPKMRAAGRKIWDEGWRPNHIHFMMTTYNEHRSITEKVIRSMLNEVRNSEVAGTIWLGSAIRFDEDIVSDLLKREASDLNITLRIVRQNVSGKRAAIGLILRAMSRLPINKDDLVVFMDGDFILSKGAISYCMPLFKIDPDLQACTTDEEVICIGPQWVEIWLKMRFAQRRLAMQSHALSGRVLTLTGRMSVFRARHLLKLEFIRLLEADHLNHWLWGDFRFLSGDDKSTWYYMLKNHSHMCYVPDALGYTVEVIHGSGMDRMVQNFRRWSGNMLRNGSRATKLGPANMPLFIWWCLIDQRLSMWTMLLSPVLALCASVTYGASYLIAYIIFIAISRMLLSLFLFSYSRKIQMSYPCILYLNQLINASVKVYSIFRLSKQKWSNRGNQTSEKAGGALLESMRNGMANWCTLIAVLSLFILTLHYAGIIDIPSYQIMTEVFRSLL